MYGQLDFAYGDYLIIPRGTIYQINFTTEQNRLFIVGVFQPDQVSEKIHEQIRPVAGTLALLRKRYPPAALAQKHLM